MQRHGLTVDTARADASCRPAGWLLALVALLFAPSASACVLGAVSLTPLGDSTALLRIEHDGTAGLRQLRNGSKLVLFIERCRTTAGLHEAPVLAPPVSALRWSDHREDDAVWVVVELPADAGVRISARATAFELTLTGAAAPAPRRWPLGFRVVHPLPPDLVAAMGSSWREGCPVPLADLSLVQVTHLGFDDRQHQGDLVVHASLADEVVAIFADLLAAECPIERVRLIDRYGGDDEASMADNNTSAFNCRLSTGSSSRYSVHSSGRAIDINPVQNPYVRGEVVLPPAGRAYLDRTLPAKGKLLPGDACQGAFARRGWTWGGDWKSLRDYQHFEKP